MAGGRLAALLFPYDPNGIKTRYHRGNSTKIAGCQFGKIQRHQFGAAQLIPGAREYEQIFALIRFGGPPTNNHAERALRSLRPHVIFRKACLGSRSRTGSENVAIFTNLAETTKLHEGKVIDQFQALSGRIRESGSCPDIS